MLAALITAFCLTLLMLAVLQIDSKIVQNLPENNRFKKWWNRHVATRHPD
jgi:hypothetical protein